MVGATICLGVYHNHAGYWNPSAGFWQVSGVLMKRALGFDKKCIGLPLMLCMGQSPVSDGVVASAYLHLQLEG